MYSKTYYDKIYERYKTGDCLNFKLYTSNKINSILFLNEDFVSLKDFLYYISQTKDDKKLINLILDYLKTPNIEDFNKRLIYYSMIIDPDR